MKWLVFLTLLASGHASTDYRRIHNGRAAPPRVSPWIAAMLIRSNGNIKCAGSIITERVVLTAAHCFNEKINIFIRVGTNNIRVGGVDYEIQSIHVHERFNPNRIQFDDIAIVTAQTTFRYTNLVQPISPVNQLFPPGTAGLVLTGWGLTETGQYPNELKITELRLVGLEDCKHLVLPGNDVQPTQVCALADDASSSCFGDSGGPLTFGGALVGIVSYGGGQGQCAIGVPDFYTSVFHYKQWVNQALGGFQVKMLMKGGKWNKTESHLTGKDTKKAKKKKESKQPKKFKKSKEPKETKKSKKTTKNEDT